MRSLPTRHPSSAAVWALRLALFAPILGVMSLLTHSARLIDTPSFLSVLLASVVIAFLALLLTTKAFHDLWTRGMKGGVRASWALFFCVLVFVPTVTTAYLVQTRPDQADTSTDLIDPPLFVSETSSMTGNVSAIVAAELRDGYSDLAGHRYNTDPQTVMDSATAIAEQIGLRPTSRQGRIGADDDLLLEFQSEVPILRIPGKAVIRITDEGETTFVDMRARSSHLSHDLGYNAHLIGRFLGRLDRALVDSVRSE